MNTPPEIAVRDTRNWLERAVIGLNLCPFAKAVHAKNQVHYAVSPAIRADEVLDDLAAELDALATIDAKVRDTTLLIVPRCLRDFLEFNDLLRRAGRLIRRQGFEGVIQLASFHPEYQFADSEPGDAGNFSNRSPYPTIQLLREASVERAVAAISAPEDIYQANIRTLHELGGEGWKALDVGPTTA